MGRNKIEKEFGQKLNNREIMPSAASWDRLDAMLTQAEEQKNKKGFQFKWSIAAAIVGILLVSGFFIKSQITVAESVEENIKNNQQVTFEASEKGNSISTEATSEVENSDVEISNSSSAIAESTVNPSKKSNSRINSVTNISGNTKEEIKSEVVSNPSKIQTDDSNTEMLLASVKAKIDSREKEDIRVDAKNLLDQVDEEPLELNKRRKLLKALNKNYQSVKVAVENRNLEENH